MRLRLSEAAAKGLGRDEAAKAEEKAAKAKADEKRRAERKAEQMAKRAAEKEAKRAAENRAARADIALSEAIDVLKQVVAHEDDLRLNADRRASEAAEVRTRVRRLEENLAAERERLAALEKASRRVDVGRDDAEAAVMAAWEEHETAWSGFPTGYVKKHRDRSVRRSFREFRLRASRRVRSTRSATSEPRGVASVLSKRRCAASENSGAWRTWSVAERPSSALTSCSVDSAFSTDAAYSPSRTHLGLRRDEADRHHLPPQDPDGVRPAGAPALAQGRAVVHGEGRRTGRRGVRGTQAKGWDDTRGAASVESQHDD